MGKDKFTFTLAIGVVQMAKNEYALAQKTFLMENQVNLESTAIDGDAMWPKYTLNVGQTFEHQFNFQEHPANHALCVPLNNEELKRVVVTRGSLVAHGERFLVDPTGRPDIEYCNRVLNQFLEWYERSDLAVPEDCLRLIVPPNTQQERWSGSKSDLAKYINEEFERNKPKYLNSLRIAAGEFFAKYGSTFTDWTFEQCYGLARKQ